MAWKMYCVFVLGFQMMSSDQLLKVYYISWRGQSGVVHFLFSCFNQFFFFHNTHLLDRNIDGIEKTVRVLVTRACLPLWKISVVSMLYFTRPWHVLICHWEIWQHPIQIIHVVLFELQAPYCFPLITFNSSWDALEFIYTEHWPGVHLKYNLMLWQKLFILEILRLWLLGWTSALKSGYSAKVKCHWRLH